MKKQFRNLNELAMVVDALAKKALQEDHKIKDVVVDEMVQSIEKNVYSKYSPRMYSRKEAHGGLTDKSNFKAEPTQDGVAIYSTREGVDRNGNNVYVAEVIEGYVPYSIQDKWRYGYESKREFVEPTRDSLRQNGKHLIALKESLKKHGLDVK
ncbi:hypothetical protein [Brevibacillus porteri]|uniref:hypothetical protein n=1 Tax=Brevibacillus porteri TaxID=2126350 RepID=UPI00363053FC